MNRASARCITVGVCQSLTYFALCTADVQQRGVTTKPRRSAGSSDFENEPHVHDPARAIKCLQRFDRASGEPKLCIVVILEDGGIVPRCPVEQSKPARERHRHSKRILMRGSDVHQSCPARQRLHHQPFFIDGNSEHSASERLEEEPRRQISGVLDGHPVAMLEQSPRHDIERLLRTVRNRDVVSRHLHPAAHADMPRDGLAQLVIAGRMRVNRRCSRLIARLANEQAPPCVMRKQ